MSFEEGSSSPEACLQHVCFQNRSEDPALVQRRGLWTRKIRTNEIQRIAAVAIHARRGHIHGSVEVEVLVVAEDGALYIPTRGIRLDEVGQHFASAARRGARLIETAHWRKLISEKLHGIIYDQLISSLSTLLFSHF